MCTPANADVKGDAQRVTGEHSSRSRLAAASRFLVCLPHTRDAWLHSFLRALRRHTASRKLQLCEAGQPNTVSTVTRTEANYRCHTTTSPAPRHLRPSAIPPPRHPLRPRCCGCPPPLPHCSFPGGLPGIWEERGEGEEERERDKGEGEKRRKGRGS